MQFTDTVTLLGTRKTADGYLVAEVACARTGIQHYHGTEMGRGDGMISVYRDESEVFDVASLASFVGKPVTDNHPPEMVNADNWAKYAKGTIGEGVLRDGERIKVPITLMDSELIRAVENGKREISMGYTADIVWGDGQTADGQPYHAKQTNIKINHLAIVDKGRAGESCRIGDKLWGDKQPKGVNLLKTVIVDGLTVETTEAGAVAINKLQTEKQAAEQKVVDMEQAHSQAIATKDAELAKKDAKIDELKKQKLSDADLDKLVAARADILAKAKALHDADYTGKSEQEIKRMVVTAKVGDMTGKTEAYIDARFDLLLENDPFAEAMKDNKPTAVQDNGYQAYVDELSRAWEGK
ncbi:hypothetical protein B0181_10585 [Moraxella caviae]|uniref:Uncharacterized protein conserved in bacteria n=1 Tax=Moraxella caviae TaxID=34060 RepID=A0A1S9ZUV4_9GAMM|nr:DUF2213 domain-containing protein [Moraxella caviae]OOR87288.1 hypothetical protein B0181_10585 [Moraxella caviae]STZ14046.1 Uncharacterized protein conserved in bacteria [Moraxella caviae]